MSNLKISINMLVVKYRLRMETDVCPLKTNEYYK